MYWRQLGNSQANTNFVICNLPLSLRWSWTIGYTLRQNWTLATRWSGQGRPRDIPAIGTRPVLLEPSRSTRASILTNLQLWQHWRPSRHFHRHIPHLHRQNCGPFRAYLFKYKLFLFETLYNFGIHLFNFYLRTTVPVRLDLVEMTNSPPRPP